MKRLDRLITAPLITEKGTLVNEQGNQFLFRVRPAANKIEIRKAVEQSAAPGPPSPSPLSYLVGLTRSS